MRDLVQSGIDTVTEYKHNVNSDNARRVLDGAVRQSGHRRALKNHRQFQNGII